MASTDACACVMALVAVTIIHVSFEVLSPRQMRVLLASLATDCALAIATLALD